MTSLGSGALLFGFDAMPGSLQQPTARSELLGRVRFVNEGPVEMDRAFGSELDGRLYTSLDELSEETLVTPEERFYVRTRASRLLSSPHDWTVGIDGLAAGKGSVTIPELQAREKQLGLQLMECAGNTRAAHFGMISVGKWSGVPMTELLEEF